MANAVDIVVNVITRMDASGLDQASGKMGKFQGALKKATVPALAAGAAIVAFGAKSIAAASDLEQSQGAVESVFGKSADTILEWADSAATGVGLAKSEYQSLATVIGSQLKNMGLPLDQVTGKTGDLIKKAADLSATFGGTTQEAVEALSSTLRGETDPIEKYGVSINQAAIQAEMMRRGTDKLTGEQGKQAKAMATLSLINKQTADSQGAFNREQDTAAHQAQVASAEYENMTAALGTALLPAVAAVTGKLATMAKFASEHTTLFQILIGVVGAFAAAILILNVALKVYTISTVIAGNATAMAWIAAAWPVLLVVAAIAAVIVILVLLWKKCDAFRNAVTAVWNAIKRSAVATWNFIKAAAIGVFNWIKSNWPLLIGILLGPVGIAAALIIKNWDSIKKAALAVWAVIKAGAQKMANGLKAVWNGIKSAVRATGNAIKAIWRAIWAAASAYVRAYVNVAKAAFNVLKNVVGFVVNKVKDLQNAVKNIKVPAAIRSAFEAVRNAVERVIGRVKDVISALRNMSVPGAVKGALDAIGGAADRALGFIKDVVHWLGNLPTPHINWPSPPSWLDKVIPGSFAAPVVPSGMVATPRVRGRANAGATATAAPVVINVNGALDPDAVARQIRRLLGAHDRRVGVAT